MKRMFILGAAVAALFLLQAAHGAVAGDKVKVCHLNSSNTSATYEYAYSYEYTYYGYTYSYSYSGNYTYSFGNVIEVAVSSLDAHTGHGDSTSYIDDSYSWWDWYVEYLSNWSQYSGSWDYSWDYRPDWDYYGWQSGYETLTDAEVKNADCMVWASE